MTSYEFGDIVLVAFPQLAKIANLEKRAVSRQLGHLSDHDKAELVILWR